MLVPFFQNNEWYSVETWDHKIELYRDLNPTFYPEDREFLGTVMLAGESGQWDQGYLDTPSVLTLDIFRDSFPDENIWLYYTGREINFRPYRTGLAKGTLESLAGLMPQTHQGDHGG